MTKEELTVWRKEARRVRNRESAAASRNKTRDRISELEGKVHSLQSKYASALERIIELEAGNTHFVTPDNIRQDLIKSASEWRSSKALSSSACVSPTLSPQTTTAGSTASGDPGDVSYWIRITKLLWTRNIK